MSQQMNKTELENLFKEEMQMQQDVATRNMMVCKELKNILSSSFGPKGMNKLVVNVLEKVFLTSDAGKIMEEIDIIHPVAKFLYLTAKQQQNEFGDGTNLVVLFSSTLLELAGELVRIGISSEKIIEGFQHGHRVLLETLPSLVVERVKHEDKDLIQKIIKCSMQTKEIGGSSILFKLVTEACFSIYKDSVSFQKENIRTTKILGSSISGSFLVNGMVFSRIPESKVKETEKAKVVVFSCPIDLTRTETKGTVLLTKKEEILNVSENEEKEVEKKIKDISDKGVKVLVTGGAISDMMLHFIDKYQLLAIKVVSKFEIQRISKVVGAKVLTKFETPIEEEIGFCDSVKIMELGNVNLTLFKQERKTEIATIVLRGATLNILDDMERAVENGVCSFKTICKDERVLPGGGSVEIELSRKIKSVAKETKGLNQYGLNKYAEALEIIPKTLANNSGKDGCVCVADLYAAHEENKYLCCVCVEDNNKNIVSFEENDVYDLFLTKKSSFSLSFETAISILKIDQIIMSRPVGGPASRKPLPQDMEN